MSINKIISFNALQALNENAVIIYSP